MVCNFQIDKILNLKKTYPMKFHLFLIVVLIAFASGCETECSRPDNPNDLSTHTVLTNHEDYSWGLSIHYSDSSDYFSFGLVGFNELCGNGETFFIGNIPLKTGCYILNEFTNSEVLYSRLSYYEERCYYIPLKDFNNYIEIEEVDMDKQFVKGNYEVTLAQDSLHPCFPEKIDTFKFTQGKFELYLYEKNDLYRIQ